MIRILSEKQWRELEQGLHDARREVTRLRKENEALKAQQAQQAALAKQRRESMAQQN